MPDVYVPCTVCGGKRYNFDTLEVRYKGKNIFEVLDMTVEEAYEFFRTMPKIEPILRILLDTGLGTSSWGQPSTTLSGGEAQRIKLATHLSKRQTGRTLFILDEPTTGLHSADVKKLIDILSRLGEAGNTIVVIEHNLDVIKWCRLHHRHGPCGRRRRRAGNRRGHTRGSGRGGRKPDRQIYEAGAVPVKPSALL